MNFKLGLKKIQSLAGVVIFLGILVAVNFLASGMRQRIDLTEEKLFTISDGTRNILKNIPRDVTLKFYFSKSFEGVPIPIKQYAQRIEDLLNEYELNSDGKLVLETYDPKPDSDEEEWAQRYGVQGQAIGLLGGGPALYLGLVAVSGTREAVIPMISPSAEPQLEYLITRLIYQVATTKKPRLGVLSALPVMGRDMMPYAMGRGPEPWAIINELRQNYDVVPVARDAEEISRELDALLVIHPQDLGEKMLFNIDQFVMNGGKMIVFEDPQCLMQGQEASAMGGMPDMASDLNRLTRAWGAEMQMGRVVSDLKAATRLRTPEGGVDRNAHWLSLRTENIDRDEVATTSLEFMMLPFAGALSLTATGAVKATALIQTSGDAGTANSYEVMNPGAAGVSSFQKAAKPVALAVRLQGRFQTAYPNGAPPDPVAGTNAPPPGPPPLKESVKETVVVLVSDVDMISDRISVQQVNFFGSIQYQLANDNLVFALNMVEQLLGSDDLIGLRSRGTVDRPFDKVIELEKQAQERWQAEEAKLQEKLSEAQGKLNELQSNKDPSQKFILSAEQKQEIEKFRNEQFDAQQKLKEVRRNFRSEIESLGTRLKVINLAAVPALIAIYGIARGMRRRKAT